MKILILQGHPAPDGPFDAYIDSLRKAWEDRGATVKTVILREQKITPCTGCFKCWIKTPGRCVLKDDAEAIAQKYIGADYIILATPLILGYFSALMKNALDRSIPLMHPHLEEVDEEIHHRKRYDRYPGIGVLLQREADTDEEDIDIVSEISRRMSINMRTRLHFVKLTDSPVQEVAHAIDLH